MARLDTSHGQLVSLALDSRGDADRRAQAIGALALFDDDAVLRALVVLVQEMTLAPELRAAAGRSLAQYCYRRLMDVDELIMARMSEEADEAYDSEIARLLALNPGSVMQRGVAGSGR